MTIDWQNPEIQFAADTVRQAAGLVRIIQQELVEPALTKDDRSPVTVADFAAQCVAGCMLERAFPGDPLVGEESADALKEPGNETALDLVVKYAGRAVAYATANTVCDWIDRGAGKPAQRFWTIDPIDGTKGFLRGEQYAVALALIEDGQTRIGALGCPNLGVNGQPDYGGSGSIMIAARGQGAWAAPLDDPGAQPRPLRVSGAADPAQARVLRSVESGHTNVGQLDHILAHMGNAAEPVQMDSQAKYGALAAGHGDLLFRLLSPSKPDYREMIWDQAAGSLIVEEAGGQVSDIEGRPLDFSAGKTLARNRGVLASNGELHNAALEAIAATAG